ncbi:MAG: division/cell wall cluster transcriptional repressor MraZ [Patescibacteria group bacterium]|nr:division/cell wall cluster transcriptional repressor MraZ [Patescibacteria group bacterium]MDE2438576.1 division/cell wall cluster transcriptional repressor MraZ [Patescibacteria group bacterium]
MFIGEYSHNLDEKGRMAVPVKFRADLAGGAIVTRGLDSCLFVYTMRDWEQLAGKLTALPLSQANSRAFARLMLAGAMNVEVDSQGRVLIPEYLRTYAGLDKKVVVAGLYNRIEIWNETKWNAYKTKTEQESDDIAERMGELGI